MDTYLSGVGDHFQVLKVSEGTCTVLRTYLPTIRYWIEFQAILKAVLLPQTPIFTESFLTDIAVGLIWSTALDSQCNLAAEFISQK